MGILNSNWIYKLILIPFNLNIIYEKTSFHNWVLLKMMIIGVIGENHQLWCSADDKCFESVNHRQETVYGSEKLRPTKI